MTKGKDRLYNNQKEERQAIQWPKGRTGYTITKRKDRLYNNQKEERQKDTKQILQSSAQKLKIEQYKGELKYSQLAPFVTIKRHKHEIVLDTCRIRK